MPPRTLAIVALIALGAATLSGCTTAGAGGAEGGGAAGGDGGSPALDCSAATTGGYDLFVDPALTIDPGLDVYPLEAGDTITFSYADHDEASAPTYDWKSYYIQPSGGAVIPSTGSFFFDQADGVFTFEGPEAVGGVDGGPYAGFLEIGVTSDTTTTELARICVVFALTE